MARDRKRHRFNVPVVGAMRSGKTFFSKEKIANGYNKNGRCVLAYNVGIEDDFPEPEYTTIKPLTYSEHSRYIYKSKEARSYYKMSKQITHFFYMNSIFHFKNFNQIFKGKKVRIFKFSQGKEEASLFNCFFKYISNTLIILDDCRSTFRYGLYSSHIEFFNRCNHAGGLTALNSFKNKGVDIITIWHNLDHINVEILDYITGLIIFKSSQKPKLNKFENDDLERAVLSSWKKLLKLPPYTRIEIPVSDGKYIPKIFNKNQ